MRPQPFFLEKGVRKQTSEIGETTTKTITFHTGNDHGTPLDAKMTLITVEV